MTRSQNAIAAVQAFIRREEAEARKRGSQANAGAGGAGARLSKRQRVIEKAAAVKKTGSARRVKKTAGSANRSKKLLVEPAPAAETAPETAVETAPEAATVAPVAPLAPAPAVAPVALAPAVAPVALAPAVAPVALAPAVASVSGNAAGAPIQAIDQVFTVPMSQLTLMELMAYNVLQYEIPASPLNINHITNPSVVLRHGPIARLQGVATVAGYEPPVQRSAYGRRDPRFDFC
jgi:hypothetical protein